MLIHGSCHCGNVTFDLDWPAAASPLPARACGCSFCRKHGGVWTSHPDASLRVRVEQPARLSSYAFETGTATFHVCALCGVVPLVTSDIDGRRYAVVNVHACDDIDASTLRVEPASFDGESVDVRLERRKKGWIPDVQFNGTPTP